MQGPRRRAFVPAATLSVAGLVALPQTALADVLAPDSPASSGATAAQTMYYVMGVLGLLVSLAVVVTIVRAVRSSRGRDAEPERRTRGTAGVQRRVGVGLGAAVLIIFIVGIVFTERARTVDASESSAKPITIQVDGQQWLWRYAYPPADNASADGFNTDQPYSYYDLVIPVDTPVTLEVSSTDVLHRWWVPALTKPVEAVPGDTNEARFIPDEIGTYYGRSTAYSGQGYATMRTAVHVVSEEAYQAFLKQRTEDIKAARDAVQSRVDDGTAPGVALR